MSRGRLTYVVQLTGLEADGVLAGWQEQTATYCLRRRHLLRSKTVTMYLSTLSLDSDSLLCSVVLPNEDQFM
jgi:hypothetical protein